MEFPGLEGLLEKCRIVDPSSPRSIAQFAKKNEKPINEIILEILNPNEQEEEKLRTLYPTLFLSPEELERLYGIISDSEFYRSHLQFKDLYTSEDEEKMLDELAKKIHTLLSERDKATFQKSDVVGALHHIAVMNLGVLEIPLKGTNFREYIKQNSDFFLENEELAVSILKNHYMKQGEALYNGNLEAFIKDTRKELNELGLTKKIKGSKKKLTDIVINTLQERVDYSKELYGRAEALKLFFHQTNRIFEAVQNGTKRIICADATGAGKTIIAARCLLLYQ